MHLCVPRSELATRQADTHNDRCTALLKQLSCQRVERHIFALRALRYSRRLRSRTRYAPSDDSSMHRGIRAKALATERNRRDWHCGNVAASTAAIKTSLLCAVWKFSQLTERMRRINSCSTSEMFRANHAPFLLDPIASVPSARSYAHCNGSRRPKPYAHAFNDPRFAVTTQ